ncbi:MAG: L-serine ammonia-lyase [Solirubrobacteraceae bacterium]
MSLIGCSHGNRPHARPPVVTSVFELFTVGIGPSSSHTVGPMRAARRFAESVADDRLLATTARVHADLYGSLGATGRGHGTPKAIMLGLEGARPDEIDPDTIDARLAVVRQAECLQLLGRHAVAFSEHDDIEFRGRERLPGHPNAMRMRAFDATEIELYSRTYFSVGGGFIAEDGEAAQPDRQQGAAQTYPFASAAELLDHCHRSGLRISDLMLANERCARTEHEIRGELRKIWDAMQACVRRGCGQEGVLPGGLNVLRRAASLRRALEADAGTNDPLRAMDWIELYALAVNEENAAGGRVVTAPTNGAAGIVPAVLHYYRDFAPGFDEKGVARFLLAAGAIGTLYKRNASISGADVGCQGEVGSASSMAAAGLAEALGGTPAQVENAAEIAMEHNLGLTCDPVGGLVQIPCIERNALASVKAVAAARLALRGDGRHRVSLDTVIKTMRDTGADMSSKYKETSRGGLAVNVAEC